MLLAGVGRVLVLLVRGDRLVLGAVVGGELAAAQREQRRQQADAGHGRLARRPFAGRRARSACPAAAAPIAAERARVLHRQPGLGQRALHERDHRHRLAELA